MRIAEVDIDVGFHAEPFVVGKLRPTVPGQGFVELVRQLPGLPDQGADHGLGVPASDLREHDIARVTLNQRDDEALVRSPEQVALPVAWHSPILYRCGSLADRHGIDNGSALASLFRCVLRAAHDALRPQMRHQLLL